MNRKMIWGLAAACAIAVGFSSCSSSPDTPVSPSATIQPVTFLNADGSSVPRLTTPPEHAFDVNPAWKR